MFKHDPDDLKPCPHMETLVSGWLDGALNGLQRWYTQWHVSQCPRCSNAVPVLRVLKDRLHGIAEQPSDPALTPEQRAAVETAWQRADQLVSPASAPSVRRPAVGWTWGFAPPFSLMACIRRRGRPPCLPYLLLWVGAEYGVRLADAPAHGVHVYRRRIVDSRHRFPSC